MKWERISPLSTYIYLLNFYFEPKKSSVVYKNNLNFESWSVTSCRLEAKVEKEKCVNLTLLLQSWIYFMYSRFIINFKIYLIFNSPNAWNVVHICIMQYIEPVFLVWEFSLRYLLIFQDQILVLDFSTSRYQKKNSQMRFWDDSETRR